ncbi:MAG: hypothetical protein M1825_004768 [Sarcosagium campestre]|nr:MAG: hypothetical protein M1825_004768 [Sarcosagium campestre]
MAIYSSNCIDTPAIMWGCLWTGGIISPANPGYTIQELAFQLRDSGAKALITQQAHLSNALEAAKEANIPSDRIVIIGDDGEGDAQHFFDFIKPVDYASPLPPEIEVLGKAHIDPGRDVAFLVYSSGTTGQPKGVMLSHTNIVSNILQLEAGEAGNLTHDGGPRGEGDKTLSFLPFFHIYGLTCQIHQAIYIGLTLVVMARFDLERFCAVVEEHQITFAYVVPPVVLLLGKHPVVDRYDLSSIRMMNSGAAPLTAQLVEAVYQRLKIPIKQGYGLSETSPTTHMQDWKDWRTTVGSVGRLLPNQMAKYMSPEEEEVPVGQTGELWIKGPNVFLGYLNNPEGTRNALSADGYLKTGDVGHQDCDGSFFITDRAKELIKYKGYQVAPAELEGLLAAHPKVRDVAVVGLYDAELASEVPRAFIVPAEGADTTEEVAGEISHWLQDRVANHKRLRGGVAWIDEVPKSASGKILRRLLRVEAEKQQSSLRAKL